jgi:hypothetical protein
MGKRQFAYPLSKKSGDVRWRNWRFQEINVVILNIIHKQ